MPNRAQRREAERLARKTAFQEARKGQQPQATEPSISGAQLAANRANAKLSTGPVTSAGREASARNALKTGLTGQTVLLPMDDAAEYSRRLQNAISLHAPATEEEQILVQSIVDTDWRLDRIVTLESAIYLKGSIEFADTHAGHPAAHRKALIQAETYLKYEKPLRNLHIQEARLQRLRARKLAELKALQTDRVREEEKGQKGGSQRPLTTQLPNGFEFSKENQAPSVPPSAAPDELFIQV